MIGEVNVERALNWGKTQQAETLVVLTHRLEQSTITSATAALQRHNEANNTQTRYVRRADILFLLFTAMKTVEEHKKSDKQKSSNNRL